MPLASTLMPVTVLESSTRLQVGRQALYKKRGTKGASKVTLHGSWAALLGIVTQGGKRETNQSHENGGGTNTGSTNCIAADSTVRHKYRQACKPERRKL